MSITRDHTKNTGTQTLPSRVTLTSDLLYPKPIQVRLPGTQTLGTVISDLSHGNTITVKRCFQASPRASTAAAAAAATTTGLLFNRPIFPETVPGKGVQDFSRAVDWRSFPSPARQRHRPAHPLPGDAGRPKFNQLEMVTTFTYKPSLVRIDSDTRQRKHRQTL